LLCQINSLPAHKFLRNLGLNLFLPVSDAALKFRPLYCKVHNMLMFFGVSKPVTISEDPFHLKLLTLYLSFHSFFFDEVDFFLLGILPQSIG
jgi:hypothetical protein